MWRGTGTIHSPTSAILPTWLRIRVHQRQHPRCTKVSYTHTVSRAREAYILDKKQMAYRHVGQRFILQTHWIAGNCCGDGTIWFLKIWFGPGLWFQVVCAYLDDFYDSIGIRCPTNLQKRGLCNRGSSEMCHVNGQDKIKYYVGSNIKFSNWRSTSLNAQWLCRHWIDGVVRSSVQ